MPSPYIKRSIKKFIQNLYDALQDHRNQNVIKWIENGTQICILSLNQLAGKLKNKGSKSEKGSSLVRQFNIYGFKRVKTRIPQYKQTFIYQHSLFIKGQRDLLSQMARINNDSQQKQLKIMSDQKFFQLNDNQNDFCDGLICMGDIKSVIQNPSERLTLSSIEQLCELTEYKEQKIDLFEINIDGYAELSENTLGIEFII